MQWSFGRDSNRRYYLQAGVGYYDFAAEEYEDGCFLDCDIHEYYSDSSMGGHLGLGAEFDVGDPGGLQLGIGGKVHFVDFDDPVELDAVSSLGGPIYQLQLSVAWAL